MEKKMRFYKKAHRCFVWLTRSNNMEPFLKCQPYLHILLSQAIFDNTYGIIDSPDPSI